MQYRTAHVLLWSIVAVLAAAGSASAEEKASWFSNPFLVSSGVENVPSSGGGLALEGVMLVTPSRLSYYRASGRTRWGMGYQPEFEFRSGTGLLSSFNHSADANFEHLFSRRTKLNFGDSFVKSSDPARLFTENIFVMPQDGFRENAFAMTLSHEVAARTTVNLRFDNTLTRMTAGGAGSTVLNQSGVAGTVGISEHLSPRHKITLSYSLLKFRPYRFDAFTDPAQFAANIPMVKAGIALFGAALATSVSRSSPNPTGIASTSPQTGLATSGTSGSSDTPTVVHTSTSVSAAGQTAEVSAGPVSTGSTAKVAVAAAPVTASAAVAVPPANVPLVPTVTAPTINPTLPLVGVVTPLPATTSSTDPCATSTKKDCAKKAAEAAKAASTTVSKTATPPVNSLTSTSSASTSPAAPATTGSPTGNSTAITSAPVSSQGAPQNLEMFGHPFHVLSATYTFAYGPGLLIEVSGGAMHDRDMSYLLGLQVERRIDRLWLAGGFQRFLSYYGTMPFQGSQPSGSIALPNGIAASSVFYAWTGRVGGKLNRRTDLDLSVSLSNSTANFVVHDVRSTIGRARINYWLTNKLSLFADFESFHESGQEVEVMHFSRQRYFGGLLVRLSSAPGPVQRAEK
jgi:hypothetical protein